MNFKKTLLAATSTLFCPLICLNVASAGGVTIAEQGENKLKASGTFFINMTQNSVEGDGTVAGNGQKQKDEIGTALNRAYLTFDYQANDIWSVSVTSDALLNTQANGKKTEVFIKRAYIQGKFSDATTLEAGVINTPWLSYEHKLNQHRYVHSAFIATSKFDHSADAGVSLKGKAADGLFEYHIAALNGGGYSNIATTNTLDFNSRLGFYPMKGLTMDVQLRDGYKGSKYWDKTTQSNMEGTKHRLTQFMVTYGEGKQYRIGANVLNETSDRLADTAHNVTPLTTKSTGYDVWGRVQLNNNYGLFGQYEVLTKTKDQSTVEPKSTRFVGGVEYIANPNTKFALVMDSTTENNALFTSGATIKSNQYGIYSLLSF